MLPRVKENQTPEYMDLVVQLLNMAMNCQGLFYNCNHRPHS